MTRATPAVDADGLHQPGGLTAIPLDSPAWLAWLADEHHHTFHFYDAAGGFTARKERRQRGSWYWIAYRQRHGRLYKAYLGKAEALTAERLAAVSRALAVTTEGDRP
jgi:LuxR family maltose regulon positive regulatory protein